MSDISALTTGDEYRVNLDIFEGPLDLLMHLIRKNDLDIYDIPVSFVLEKYMSYLDTLKELDIDMAGDFLLMAAELAHIKSQMLLPDEPIDEEAEDDPRHDLVRRLLEYQQFKGASEELMKRQVLGRDVFMKQSKEDLAEESDGPIEGNIYELVEVFSKLLEKVPAGEFHDVAIDRISVNDRIYQIVGMMKKGMTISLEELLAQDYSKYNIVVSFLALLEMTRLRMIRVYQSSTCGPIQIQYTMGEVSDDDVARLIEIDVTSVVEGAVKDAKLDDM